ncbi:MAG TPA: argininosuccinate synthase domain-containing protein, partial [Vicinamibacterales bacterium]|nr:argininosuccinate synthase domain-containing protein [Vicinamibacterales bacterium]
MSTIVLAYSGGFISSNAVHWLTETYAADVVTVTLDVGQGEDLGALRARALSCGATRAHAIDAREELVREFLLPSLVRGPLNEGPSIAEFTRPLIARKLLEVARIEGASVVAHGSFDESLDAAIRTLDPRITIIAPAREWKLDPAQLS